MTTLQLEGNDIQKFLDMAINQFNLITPSINPNAF